MIHRRALLLAMILAGLVPASGRTAPEAGDTEDAKKLQALFDRIVREQMQRNPELATFLGVDHGDLMPLKSRLSDVSLASDAKDRADNAARIATLQAIPRDNLSPFDASSYDTVMFTLQVTKDGFDNFPTNGGDVSSPYVVSQLVGAYHDIPDFLDTQHSIADAADATAYLSRLAAFAVMMDQELARMKHDAALGVIPPDFVIDKTLIQMNLFLKTPADKSVLVNSLVQRAKDAGLAGDYRAQASVIYNERVLPALQRQADHFAAIRPTAVHAAGCERLPKGAEYYALGLKHYTTSSMTPTEIHQEGLKLVAELTAGLDTALRAQGYAEGTVGQRLAVLTGDRRYIYDNTDAAKDTLIADLNRKVETVQAKLPQWFDKLPKTRVEIRRVPKATEAGAPGGYYQPGSLDGKRPGIYYINLRDTAEVPRWALPTLTYHEAIPGHHLQLTLAQEMKDLPLIRKIVFFSGYGEGWALYAEQLAVEMGMYDQDPVGHIGQMKDALFRAVRLVVDSGLHAQNWSREQATKYFVDMLGDKETAAITEVERYCVWPGQACSYMVGKLTWLRLRQKAKDELGAKYDIKQFHDAGLLSGAVPLDVLDRLIGRYISTTKA